MGSQLNFKKLGNEPPGDGGVGMNRLSQGITPLTRQGSIYSLTFDEFQSSLGKDFGSLNMDELLKNIWSAEETQAMASTSGIPVSGQNDLQRQGSLTLPRTLSQKTVDEVWKDLSKEYISGKDRRVGGANMSQTHSQRQQTLGEVTLEEFLVRAGVVREENQMASNLMPDKGGFFGNQLPASASPVRFQQASGVAGLMANLGPDTANHMQAQGSSLPLNVNGVRSIDQQHHCVQQQPPIMPKQPGFGYGTKIGLPSGQVTNPGIRGGLMGLGDQSLTNNMGLVQGGLGLTGAVGVGAASPVTPLSSEEIGKSNGDSSSLSPSPYMFNSGVRGTKSSGAVEKVVERRQRRMIKNRESAARSRARKQAYTVELEAEVAKLKEENEQLQRKQAEILEMQKNQPQTTDDNNERQEMEMMNRQEGPQKRLRTTQSGPW